jgi:hypothetical protein
MFSVEQHLSRVVSQLADTAYQTDQYKRNNETDKCVSLQYGNSVFLFILTEFSYIFEQHPLTEGCRAKCNGAWELVNQILDNVSHADMQYLYQVMGASQFGFSYTTFHFEEIPDIVSLYQMGWARASSLFGGVGQEHDTKVWYPAYSSDSIFSNSSLSLMARRATKFACLHLDLDVIPVCEKLEARQHSTCPSAFFEGL